MHSSTSVQMPALCSIGNIVTGDDLQTQLLSSPKEGIRKEVCWMISNITTGSPPQIQAVIDANIIPPLINILSNADFKTQRRPAGQFQMQSGGLHKPAQIRYLILQDHLSCLDGLDNILKVGEMDKQAGGPRSVNQYALYVEEVGGMITIHNLQSHDNLEIYKNVFNIMDKYFPDEEEVDAAISAPSLDATGTFADVTAPQGGFSFGQQ
ncbi:armadillo-type protein [Suillus plorans]|uniref:Armadillo-type protein n=1 Tax=Suillus plorans TaxID=116603 RepID=A0A9P7AAE5_9AGAM|nr:armadillo-type protein [Suillus plorans]KAG1784535.1 armadillo-type protein [Suillus plorans]